MSSNTSDNEVFEYTGNGQSVPKNVVNVRFHPSVVEVDEKAFIYRKSLKNVVLNDGLQKVGDGSFARCHTLESITLPSTVTNIDENAFVLCRSLKKVVLNEGLKKIGYNAFGRCESLQSITIPSTVTDIRDDVFGECINLREVVLNEGLEKIGHRSFSNCQALESIKLPSTVNEIGSHAFKSCTNLREVVCSERLPEIGLCAFFDCHALGRITFPNLSTRLYNIIQAGQVDTQNKIQQYINQGDIEWRRGDTIYISIEDRRSELEWRIVQQHFSRIINWIKYYEMKEATTLFELALWKMKIDFVDDDGFRTRDECRIEVPGPVKDAIMQYLL